MAPTEILATQHFIGFQKLLTQADLEEIAEIKKADLNAWDLEAAKKIIAGTARSMGLEVEG